MVRYYSFGYNLGMVKKECDEMFNFCKSVEL